MRLSCIDIERNCNRLATRQARSSRQVWFEVILREPGQQRHRTLWIHVQLQVATGLQVRRILRSHTWVRHADAAPCERGSRLQHKASKRTH